MNLTKDPKNPERLKSDLDTIQRSYGILQGQLTEMQDQIASLQEATAPEPVVIMPNGRRFPSRPTGVFVLPGCGLDGDGQQNSPLRTVLDGFSVEARNGILRAPMNRGRWWIMDGPSLFNAGLTGAAVVSSGAAATNLYSNHTLSVHVSTGATGAGGAGVSNGTQLIKLADGLDPIVVYRFALNADITSIRLRMGFHNGTLGDSATQPAPGAGLRYMAVDGAQWRLEQYDNVTRTTSALFGTVTASHEYRATIQTVTDASNNMTLFAKVEDLTNGDVYGQTLAIATGTKAFTTQVGQIRMFSTAATTRTYDLTSFECFFPSD